MNGISVIVCCFNSAARLTPTLRHLYNQKGIPPSHFEIIIVDNCSTDGTAHKAREIWDGFHSDKPSFRIVAERKAGLSAARQRGIESSLYNYVLFCDDDNWLQENYLSSALGILSANPFIGVLGGIGEPVFEFQEPPFFWINQYHALAVGNQTNVVGDITDLRGVVYGAGMVVNKQAFNILKLKYRFDFQVSDRLENRLLSSGDHELCLAIKKIGFRIYLSDKLSFRHFIPHSRTTIPYYKKLFFGFGTAYAMLQVYRVNPMEINSLRNDYRYNMLRCLKKIISLQIKLLTNGYYLNNSKYKYVDILHALYSSRGQLIAHFKLKNAFKSKVLTLPIFNTSSEEITLSATNLNGI